MSDNPPYMMSYGAIPKILEKIKEAAKPERFTQDFLGTKLGFPGGSKAPFIPFAKRVGLLNADGTPTEIYSKFRNPSQSGFAMAQAMRIGYKDLYERNEYAHDLSEEKLMGLIVEATGLERGSTIARSVQHSFLALKQFARFDESRDGAGPENSSESGEGPEERPPVLNEARERGLNLAYTINLNLPETTNVAVFNAIFKSLREHLLR